MQAISPSVAIPPTFSARTNNAATTGASNATTAADGGLGSTFLKLLSQELQNQDPTSPMDPTAMVGQMISLNQLDQLISINQEMGQAVNGTAGVNATGAVA
jgi:flagellar basal-body rod modification protein FlgD